MRAAALGGDASVLRERLATVERECDVLGLELDILAAKALADLHSLVDIELLGRLHIVDAEQQHDVVDLSRGRAGFLLGR